MLKDIVKNREEQSVRGPSEAKHEWDGQSPQDVGQLAEAGNGSSKMVFAQRSHAKDIGPQAWSPSDHFEGKRFFSPTLPKDFAPSRALVSPPWVMSFPPAGEGAGSALSMRAIPSRRWPVRSAAAQRQPCSAAYRHGQAARRASRASTPKFSCIRAGRASM